MKALMRKKVKKGVERGATLTGGTASKRKTENGLSFRKKPRRSFYRAIRPE